MAARVDQNHKGKDMAEAATAHVQRFDVVIVGAGFAGLYALHKLRGLDLKLKCYEAGDGVGGTWYWNRYPGARCDVESLEYSYSFSDDLQQDWEWPERFSAQPDILKYANHVADRFDLRRDIQFNTRVSSAVFDKTSNLWTVTTHQGDVVQARFCIMASGNLSLPRVPDFKGIESFKGKWYHTGQWPKEPVDFTGKRVGVIGTGSSAIQLIPVVAEQARHLTVFQRTANFSLPSGNEPLDPQFVAAFKKRYKERRAEADRTPFGIAGHPPPTKFSRDDTPEEREKAYTARWGTGGNIAFLYAYKDLLVDKEANEIASDFVRRKIRETVKDQTVAEHLLPNDHYIGTKRLCLDLGYYETYNRDNVSLVNIRKAPIVEITEQGIRTADAEYELDAIIFATGYDAMTGAILDIDIRVEGEQSLREKWAAGPKTYLGLLTAGFPNMLIITGPGSPSVKSNMIAAIEQHVDWIHGLMDYVKKGGYVRVEADLQSEEQWVSHVNEVANGTLYPLANSWYVGANIPGKPRVFMPYVAGLDKYRDICNDVAAKGYRGLVLER